MSGRLRQIYGHIQTRWRLQFLTQASQQTDNAFIESLKGSFRGECFNCHWFESLTDVKLKIEAWRNEYDQSRSH
ncbi:MAG: hypothetical protein CL868_03880 [Cytophagaceae bacterium]|nr:hypothetical protein [Cytophagaceae bacterium]